MTPERKISIAGIIIYMQLTLFYGLFFFDVMGTRPENAHSCYAVKGERFAKTREEALSYKKPFENVSLRFNALIACGFLLQLTLWIIEMV